MLAEDGRGKGRLLERMRVEVKLSSENSKKEQLFLIYNYLADSNECIEITVRKFLQVQHLVQDMCEKYGGFVIPVLDISNTFRRKQPPEACLGLIGEYLNELIANPHCSRDPKLYEFLFMQEVHFPNIERYDKVLTDAAVLSRRYLNSFFTRKPSQDSQAHFETFLQTRQALEKTKEGFGQMRRLTEAAREGQEAVEEIFGGLREIRGGLGFGVQPVEFSSLKTRRRMDRFSKILLQAEEASVRWEVLNETVRELQCNLYKGLHEDNAFYEAKAQQLKDWARTLNLSFLQIIAKGNQLIDSMAHNLLAKKKEQNDPYRPN